MTVVYIVDNADGWSFCLQQLTIAVAYGDDIYNNFTYRPIRYKLS